MSRTLILTIGLVAATPSCSRQPAPPADQPSHELLAELQPPPLNKPIQQPPLPQRPAPTQLPPGPGSALTVVRDGQPFRGDANLTGRVAVSAERIRIEPEQGSPLELLYRLPSGLPALTVATGAGTIAVSERSGPAHANRQVTVRLESQMVLGETWRQAATPNQLDLGNGVRLVQQAVRSTATGYTDVPLDAVGSGRVLARIPMGQAFEIQTAAGRYVVFAETSQLFIPSESDAGQVASGYILRAWIVAAK